MQVNIKIVFSILLSTIVISYRSYKNANNNLAVIIPDSLMNIVRIDSSNEGHIYKNLGTNDQIRECDLSFQELYNIENDIYKFMDKDSLLRKSWIFDKFNQAKRQYIYLVGNSDSCLYILYTFYSPDDLRSVSYFKLNPQIWNKYFLKFISNNRISQFEVRYSLINKGIITYFDLQNIITTPERERR